MSSSCMQFPFVCLQRFPVTTYLSLACTTLSACLQLHTSVTVISSGGANFQACWCAGVMFS